MTQGIKGTTLNERFRDALIARQGINLVEVVGEVAERALFLAGGHDRFHHLVTDIADSAQAKADVLTDRLEIQRGLIDIRGEHLDTQVAAVRQVDRGLVLIVRHRGQQCRHVLGGVVGLEVGGPVGHQAIAGGVGLVERVGGEGQDRVPQGLSTASLE